MTHIALDATPLGLLVQPAQSPSGDLCKQWMLRKVSEGLSFILPEIADYEVRRELIRAGRSRSLRLLDELTRQVQVSYLPITTQAMKLAAELWAQSRQRGLPTADPKALDGDVILAAQILSAGYAPQDVCIATSNVPHLAQFAPSAHWQSI